MPDVAGTAYEMISGMTPVVQPGLFVFITTGDPALVASLSCDAISTFREQEGLSMLIPLELARKSMLDVDSPMRWIALDVFSSLHGVGLTAAVSSALGEHGIPCNMVAAFHHDHVFVPAEMCDRAMGVLTALQNQAARYA
ncbi:MAG: ACT domain-containing protein [Rhodobacter sp.]|nr:ACT domain-containing protein [Rhodobacter sp.]